MADRARRQSEQRRARRAGAARQSRNAARRRANARVRKQVDARKRSSGRARKPGAKKRGGGMVPDRSRGGGPAMGKAKKVGTKSAINSSKPRNVSKRQKTADYSDPRAYRPMGTRGGYAQGKVASGRTNNKAWRQRRRK